MSLFLFLLFTMCLSCTPTVEAKTSLSSCWRKTGGKGQSRALGFYFLCPRISAALLQLFSECMQLKIAEA